MKNLNFLRENPFKKLLENYKSLDIFYKIMFVLGVIMPFILFAKQYDDIIFGYEDSLNVVLKHGIKYLKFLDGIDRKNLCYSIYQSSYPIIVCLINLISLLNKKYNLLVLIINIIMFCCASSLIVLIIIYDGSRFWYWLTNLF